MGQENNHWSQLWNLRMPKRIRCFMWLLQHDRLLTNSRFHRMQLRFPFCHQCEESVETTLHVMRDCPLAKVVWVNKFRARYWEVFLIVIICNSG